MMTGLSNRTTPHDCRLTLHPAVTKALTREGGHWLLGSVIFSVYAMSLQSFISVHCKSMQLVEQGIDTISCDNLS